MASSEEHYARHLAPIYAWMAGDFEAAAAAQDELLTRLGVPVAGAGQVLDLGCGHGLQSIPLARRGFQVVAVDTSAQLLDQLRERAGDLPVQTVEGDCLDLDRYCASPVAWIICMGDTLPHLGSLEDVQRLLEQVAGHLLEGGRFLVSFRDYTHELTGNDRFIPVRSDDDRIHTCFLEYETDRVRVHDLVYQRSESGWDFSASWYPKLRLSADWLIAQAALRGLVVSEDFTERGMRCVAFEYHSAKSM